MAEKFYNTWIDFDNFGKEQNTEMTDTQLSSIVQSKLKQFKNPYIGNKRKMIDHIVKAFQKHNIDCTTILDLFSGSAFMSIAMKLMNKTVYSNDILTSSSINAVAYVENKDIIISNEEKKYLFETRDIKEPYQFFQKYQDRFTEKEMLFLSNYSNNIQNLFKLNISTTNNTNISYGFSNSIEDLKNNLSNYQISCIKTALASVAIQNYIIEHCFVGGRLNSGQVLAKLEHRLNHARNNGLEMSFKDIRWILPVYKEDINVHTVKNMDAIEYLKNSSNVCKLAYIDPPYGGDQSDYVYMYGFFEEYLYQNSFYHTLWSSAEERMAGIAENAKKFADKKNYASNFEELISFSQNYPQIAISYNDSSWGSLEQICDVIKKYRGSVIVEEFLYSYKYRENKSSAKEYLIISKD